jgi:ADP-heptose:LPS heptosyltransferase
MGVASDLPIGLTKAVLERAGLVLTSDSGPRHIAVALNRPVISLFGPTDPAATQTFNTPEVLLTPEASDSMQEIALEKVLQAFDVRASKIPVAADGLRRDTPEAQAS